MALTMDLLHHEFEVINNFFRRGAAWVTTENAAVSAKLQGIESPDNDYVEHLHTHPNGPEELEQIICRATINELNALIEFALQEALERRSGSFSVLDEKEERFVIGAKRYVLKRGLLGNGVDITKFPNYDKLLELKELSEGFKHRQRLYPLPTLKKGQRQEPSSLLFAPNDGYINQYAISISDVSQYLKDVRIFLEHCRSESLI